MKFQSLNEFSALQKLLYKANDLKFKNVVEEILDDPVALSSIFTLASYLKIDFPAREYSRLKISERRNFLRYYLIGLTIVILELKTHNCCGIQHKFMKVYEHLLLNSANNNNYTFIEKVIHS